MARRRGGSRPQVAPDRDREDEGPDEARDERLQKVLASAGVASRRECEELILAGRVEVDRKTITELGTKVDPLRSEIRVDGVTLPQPKRVYFALNKPPGVVCTNFDPSGRTRVIDMIPTDQRVFPIGRLDRTSEGLILVTNDGALANRLTHPRYGVKKTYQVLVAGSPSFEDLELLRRGVRLAEGWAKAESVHVRRNAGKSCEMLIVLREGRNREIRRMLARIEHKVLRLRRISVGSIALGNLPLGAHRKLTVEEVEGLEEDVRQARRERRLQRKAKDAAERATGAEGGDEELGEALPARRRPEAKGPRGKSPRRDPRQRPKPSLEKPPRPANRGPVQHPEGLRLGDDDGPDDDDDMPLGDDDFGGGESFGGDYDSESFGGAASGGASRGAGSGGARPPRGKRPFRPGGAGGGRKFGKSRPPAGLGGDSGEGLEEHATGGGARPRGRRPGGARPTGARPSGGRPTGGRPTGARPSGGRPTGGRPSGGRPSNKFGRGGGDGGGGEQGGQGGGGRGKRSFGGGGPKGKKRRGGRS